MTLALLPPTYDQLEQVNWRIVLHCIRSNSSFACPLQSQSWRGRGVAPESILKVLRKNLVRKEPAYSKPHQYSVHTLDSSACNVNLDKHIDRIYHADMSNTEEMILGLLHLKNLSAYDIKTSLEKLASHYFSPVSAPSFRHSTA